MGLVRSVAKNSMAMGLVQITGQISTLILAMVLSRSLGADYTIYTSAFSVASVLFILSDFGLGYKMVIDVAPDHGAASRQLKTTLVLRGILGTVAMVLTIVLVLFQEMPTTVALAFLIIGLSTACGWIAQTFASMFTAFEKMYYVLMTSLVERAFTVTLSIALVLLGFGLGTVLLVVLTGSVLNIALSYLVCTRLIVRPAKGVDMGVVKKQLRDAVPYAVNMALINTLYALNGFLLLTIIWGMNGVEAGTLANTQFYIAFNLVVSLIAIPTMFKTALLPVITRLYHSSQELTRHAQQKVMKYMFSFGLPLTLGGIVLADKIIGLLFPNYPQSATVLRVLLPVLAISYFGTVLGDVLASAKLMRLNTVSALAGAGVNVVVCLTCIPAFGAAGAAFAFTMSVLTTNIITYYHVTRRIFRLDPMAIVLRPGLAGAGMVFILLLVPGADVFVSLAIGAAAYFGLLYVLGAIDQEDTELFMKVLKKGA
jgi:O-antigen/teichoic acid export membrane protein